MKFLSLLVAQHLFYLTSWAGKGAQRGAAVPLLLDITVEGEGIATKMMTKAATEGTGALGDHATADPGVRSMTVEVGVATTEEGNETGRGEETIVGEIETRRVCIMQTTLHRRHRGRRAGATLLSRPRFLPMAPTESGATLGCMDLPTQVVRVGVGDGQGAAGGEVRETVHRGTNPGLSTASNFVRRRGRPGVSGIGPHPLLRRRSQRLSPW